MHLKPRSRATEQHSSIHLCSLFPKDESKDIELWNQSWSLISWLLRWLIISEHLPFMSFINCLSIYRLEYPLHCQNWLFITAVHCPVVKFSSTFVHKSHNLLTAKKSEYKQTMTLNRMRAVINQILWNINFAHGCTWARFHIFPMLLVLFPSH